MTHQVLKQFADLATTVTPISPPAAVEQKITFGGTIKMSANRWAEIPANPRQRNTVERAKKAKHLMTPHPVHANVNAAQLPDGSLVKLDGHTRSHLWQSGMANPPAIIYATIWRCRSMEDAVDLYMTFDNPDAVENSHDLLYGLCQEFGIVFESTFLKDYRFTTSVLIAHRAWNNYWVWSRGQLPEMLRNWAPELQMFDQCSPTRPKFPSPLMGGALLVLRSFGKDAMPFFQAYEQDAGTKGDGKMDAVQGLFEFMTSVRSRSTFADNRHRSMVVRTVVACYENYRLGRHYTKSGAKSAGGVARPLSEENFREWIKKARKRLGEPEA